VRPTFAAMRIALSERDLPPVRGRRMRSASSVGSLQWSHKKVAAIGIRSRVRKIPQDLGHANLFPEPERAELHRLDHQQRDHADLIPGFTTSFCPVPRILTSAFF
jgi:hypothetical protein